MQPNKEKISTVQAIFLVNNAITPTAVLVIPTIAVGAASQDAWISVIAAWVIGIVIALIYGSVCRRNPGLPLMALIEKRFGRAVSVIFGVVIVQYYLSTTAVVLRECLNFLSDELLHETPLIVIATVILLVIWYAVAEGIEVIARISAIVYVGTLVFLTLGMGMQFNQMKLKYLFPIGEATLPQILQGGIPAIGWISESAFLLLLVPYISKPALASKIGIVGISIAAVQMLVVVLMVLFVFGPELPKLLAYPTFATAEIIKYGRFVERVDLIFISVWIPTAFIKICVFFYGTVHCFSHAFRIRDEKPFQIVLGILILLTALYSWPNNSAFNHYQQFVSGPILQMFNIVFPVVLMLALMWKGRKAVGSEGS
ncbi:GerAB/ArcD/ProY family transporter [Cohnella cholangitidis]|uniref:GerAB/ArcD/ProY family transporter n=1 Tax=Cohnella cholangitidis TaxID=2598458 RepID=A0A7G5BYU5_9BACL|nr:endospore germination permease [Cohnella cholangitidis]QMV42129.1 GerAB/ArcD/ProY family transporter [Cohnella cholangitidis]